MAGDSKAQGEYFGKALGGPGAQGWMTINEVRRLKNLPPIDGGDDLARATGPAEPARDEPADPPEPDTEDEADDTEAAAADTRSRGQVPTHASRHRKGRT